MTMPGRSYEQTDTKYRFGFNGKEKDDDINLGAVAFEARIYDSRIGRFLSVDRLAQKQPWSGCYNFAGNKPITHIDFLGNIEVEVVVITKDKLGRTTCIETIVWNRETLEDVKGITRDKFKVTVERQSNFVCATINGVVECQIHNYTILKVEADKTTGLDKDEQFKRDNYFEWKAEKSALFIANLIGAVDLAKSSYDYQSQSYGEESNGERITKQKAEQYRVTGTIKMATAFVSAGRGIGEFQAFYAWDLIDEVSNEVCDKLASSGFSNKQVNQLIYLTAKLGKTFRDLKKGNVTNGKKDDVTLLDAIDLTLSLMDNGFKYSDILRHFSSKGHDLNANTYKNKYDVVNQLLSEHNYEINTNGPSVKIEENE